MIYLQPSSKRQFPDWVVDLCKNGVYLAGGAVRDVLFHVEPSDYDIFLRYSVDKESVEERVKLLGFNETFRCPLGQLVTFMRGEEKLQLILKRLYQDELDLIESFDFTATMFVLHNESVTTTREAIRSVRKKRLEINRVTFPSSTLNRLYKYRNKGFYVGEAIKQIVQAIADLGGKYDPTNDTLYVD